MWISENQTLTDKKTVLIVDDEEDLTWSISKRLDKDRDILDVLCANSGHKAMDMLAKHSVDLLVTDLRMPGIDGFHLLAEVRNRYPKTHVIIMTAHGSVELKSMLHEKGKAGFIEKPFDMNELRKLIFDSFDRIID